VNKTREKYWIFKIFLSRAVFEGFTGSTPEMSEFFYTEKNAMRNCMATNFDYNARKCPSGVYKMQANARRYIKAKTSESEWLFGSDGWSTNNLFLQRPSRFQFKRMKKHPLYS